MTTKLSQSTSHGGKRNGAGRKATGATERVTITLAPSDIESLKAISPNLSAAVRQLIKDRTLNP